MPTRIGRKFPRHPPVQIHVVWAMIGHMHATVRPFDGGATQQVDDILMWMDALAGRGCSTDEFLRQVLQRERDDPDLPWEVLALLDQYYRRRKIPHDVFVSLKARLQKQSQYLGNFVAPASLIEEPIGDLEEEEEAPQPAAAVTALQAEAAPAAPAPAAPSREDELLRGRYRIMEVLRRDTSGVLVEAVDEVRADVPGVRQRIALQIIDAKGGREQDLLQRAYKLQSLSHPCIQRVFDVDAEHGDPFLTMEWLTGMSLEQFISASGGVRLNSGTASLIIRAVASALAYAHSRDVCHGDVCAANVFITEAGEVRLRGFELRGRDIRANELDDKLAFAWLAYELLSGLNVRGPGNTRRAVDGKLRQPEGVTPRQWRVLHDALLGRDGRSGNVLTTFAGDSFAVTRITAMNAFARVQPPRESGGRVAAGVVAALVLVTTWVFVDSDGWRDAAMDAEAPAAASATPEQAPQQPATAPPPVTPTPQSAAVASVAAPAPAVQATAPAAAPARPLLARLDLQSSTVEVADDQPLARIPVRRRDSLSSTVTFRWWTETGSAEVNRDYLRIQPRTEMIADGDGSVDLLVPLLPDPSRTQPRTFYVKIDAPGSGAALGTRTLTQVTIVPARLAQQTPP